MESHKCGNVCFSHERCSSVLFIHQATECTHQVMQCFRSSSSDMKWQTGSCSDNSLWSWIIEITLASLLVGPDRPNWEARVNCDTTCNQVYKPCKSFIPPSTSIHIKQPHFRLHPLLMFWWNRFVFVCKVTYLYWHTETEIDHVCSAALPWV